MTTINMLQRMYPDERTLKIEIVFFRIGGSVFPKDLGNGYTISDEKLDDPRLRKLLFNGVPSTLMSNGEKLDIHVHIVDISEKAYLESKTIRDDFGGVFANVWE